MRHIDGSTFVSQASTSQGFYSNTITMDHEATFSAQVKWTNTTPTTPLYFPFDAVNTTSDAITSASHNMTTGLVGRFTDAAPAAVTTASTTYNTTTNVITAASHGLFTGCVGNFTTTGALPTGLVCTGTVTETTKGVTEVQTITFDTVPDGGAWKITYGGNESGELAFNANAAAVQTALRLLAGLSTVTVAGDYTTGLAVTMTGVVGDASALSVTSNTLVTGATPVTPTVTETTKGVIEVQTVTFAGTPAVGAFKLTYGGEESAAINYNGSSSDVQTALRALTGLSAVTVTGTVAAGFVVTMAGVAGDTTAITVTSNTLSGTFYAIVVTTGTFKVASSYANALAGTAVALATQGSGNHTFTPITGTAPTGITLTSVDYYVIRNDANSFSVATSLVNANASTEVDLTTQGTGNLKFTPTSLSGTATAQFSNDPTTLGWIDDTPVNITATATSAWGHPSIEYRYWRISFALAAGQISAVGVVNIKTDGVN